MFALHPWKAVQAHPVLIQLMWKAHLPGDFRKALVGSLSGCQGGRSGTMGCTEPACSPSDPSSTAFIPDFLPWCPQPSFQYEKPHQQVGNEALTCRVTNEEEITGSKLHHLFGLFGKRKLSSPIFPSHPKPRSPQLPSAVSLPWLSNAQYLSLTLQVLGAGIPSGAWLWLSALQPSLPGATHDG